MKNLIDEEEQEHLIFNVIIHLLSFHYQKKLKEKGVIFTDIITAAFASMLNLVQKYFMTDGVKVDEHRLTALHAALVNGGVFVYVPKNVVIEEPLQVVFLV